MNQRNKAVAFLVISGLFIVIGQKALAVSPGDVIINEFVSNGDEWVELLNTSDNDISLSEFKLSELNNPQAPQGDILFPTEILLLELSGTIPARGILVFDVPGSKLNNEGDSIALYNGEIDLANLWQRVTYGSVNENYPVTAGLGVAPARGFSDAYLDAAWQTGQTPSMGWFNDAGREGTAPLLGENPLSIDSLLAAAGIDSNIGELENPSATPATEDDGALYFGNDEGRIVFEQTLNLTNQATVDILRDLGEAMKMSAGHIKLNSETADALAATGAKIYMYGLAELGFDSAPDLIVKNDDEEIIEPGDEDYPTITSEYEDGTLVFTTDHFTQFEVPRGIFGTKWNDADGDGVRDWNDANENGEKDEDEEYTESGISDWTIALIDEENGDTRHDITDADGKYSFPGVADGDYIVCEVKKSSEWVQTYPSSDTENGDHYDIYDACDEERGVYTQYGYEDIEIGEVVNVSNLDFGNRETAHIVVRKETYPGTDNEFEFDIDNESGDGGEELETFFLVGGEEETFNVAAGTYSIREFVPDGWRLAHISCEYDGESVGIREEDGERVDLDPGDTVTCTFTNIEEDVTIITGYKWEDQDGDGEKDDGEPGRKDWTVALGRQNGDPFLRDGHEVVPIEIIELSLTGSDGWYYLPVTEEGNYKVFEEKRGGWRTTNPASIESFFDIEYRIDSEPPLVEDSFFDVFVDLREHISDPEEELILQEGQTVTEVDGRPFDFGNFELVDITGLKWNDENEDGLLNNREQGLPDVAVALGRQSGKPVQRDGHEVVPIEIIAMTLTGADGGFVIRDIGPGRYKLFEENKSGWQATNPAPRRDSFFDITYDLDAIADGDPDFDLLRIPPGDPDFDLLRSSFFDVFVELSGQNVNQSEATEDGLIAIPAVPLHFGNHEILVEEEPPAPTPSQPTPANLPECSDGLDNDGDGFIDRQDPACTSDLIDDEHNSSGGGGSGSGGGGGGGSPSIGAGGGGLSAPSVPSQGQVLGASTENSSVEEQIEVLKIEIERLKSLLLKALEKLIAELQAQLDALLQSNQ